MEYLIVSIFIVIAILFVHSYFRSTQSQASAITSEKSRATIQRPQSAILPPLPAPENTVPHPLDDLKEQVRSGLVTLFTRPETNIAEHPRQPFTYENTDHHLLDQAKQNIESIPNFRSVHNRLQQIMNDPAINIISSLSAVIIADPVLSSKVLKIVNSAYYGRTEKVNSIGHAVILLGMVRLREILYREGMLELLKANDPVKDAMIEVFWRHATITSICAANLRVLFPGLDQGTLFTSGLIHDVGKIILVRMGNNPEYTTQSTIHDEDRIFGINHVVCGRLALEQWGFSEFMLSSIANHHNLAFMPLESLNMSRQATQYLTVLFLADQLAKMVHPGQDYLPADSLHPSFYPLIEQETFSRTALDNTLLVKISKSEAFIT
jgi:HD-like signal output (HDOD) protein